MIFRKISKKEYLDLQVEKGEQVINKDPKYDLHT